MANKVYQLEFIKDGKSTQEEIVYTDIDNVIWSLEEEGYIEIGINIYKKAKGGVIIDYAVIKELTHYEGRKLPKENVYLRDPVYYRFLLFSYESYYPSGGTGDLRISFNTIEELEDGYSDEPFGLSEYIEVFDTKTGRTVNKSDYFTEVVEEVKEYLKNN